jgi:chaperonin GroES
MQDLPTNLKALNDYVLIEVIDAEKRTKGGLYVPDNAKRQASHRGRVVSVGDGARATTDGKIIPMSTEPGDIVVFADYGTHDVVIDGKDYTAIREHNILLRIMPDDASAASSR